MDMWQDSQEQGFYVSRELEWAQWTADAGAGIVRVGGVVWDCGCRECRARTREDDR
jgi:hypothetical protein